MEAAAQPLPKLRSGLRFTPVHEHGETTYVLEDPLRHVFYRLGPEEYLFISRLNGAAGLATLLQSVEDAAGICLSVEQAGEIVRWLSARQLLQVEDAASLSPALAQEKAQSLLRRVGRLNLITIKVPLFNPDDLLSRLSPALSWLTGRVFFVLWLLLAVVALGTLVSRWQEFSSQSVGFFSARNLFVIWLVWFALKLLHELFHALVCVRYGGRVYDAGLFFILFIPLTYVNATSSWRFASKWQRIHVALAGMFAELAVAWAALLVWAGQPNSAAGFIAHNTVMIAGISSLLFNANPLMRFDGYYVLSDLVGIPNLYALGMQRVKAIALRWFLGVDFPSPEIRGGKSWFVTGYGVAIHVWRVLVIISLGYLAANMAGGFGMLAAISAAVVWIGIPLFFFSKRLPSYRKLNPALVRHAILRGVLTTVAVGLAAMFLSWEQRLPAPAVVEYQHQHSIRPAAGGFVSAVHVADGQQVATGTLLVTLENQELRHAFKERRLQLEQLEVRSRLAHSTGQLTQLDILREQRQALVGELEALERDIAALELFSPGAGMVVGSALESLPGTYLPRGKEIFWIVGQEQKHIAASASQDDIDQFRAHVGHQVAVDMRAAGLGVFHGTLRQVAPTATTELIHPALGAEYGGPLDVRQHLVGREGRDLEQYYRYELFAPRFKLDVELPESVRETVRDGQLATVYGSGARMTIGRIVAEGWRKWLRKKNSPGAG